MALHPPVRILSLFSGIGGLDIGVHAGLAWLGHAAVPAGYVEWEAFAAGILAARMEDDTLPAAPLWTDIGTFPAGDYADRIDLVVGGFPCQPWSVAGQRRRTDDERWLWDDILRTIRTVRPRYIFLENVPGLISGGGLGLVLGGLAESGFAAEWLCLRAADTGAPHQRERVFILAVADPRDRLVSVAGWGPQTRDGAGPAGADVLGDADGSGRHEAERGQPAGGRSDTSGAGLSAGGVGLADTDRDNRECSDSRHADARSDGGHDSGGRGRKIVEHSGSARLPHAQQRGEPGSAGGQRSAHATTEQSGGAWPLYPPGPGDAAAWAAVLRERPDLAPAVEPGVRLLADGNGAGVERPGAATRAGQLRALGNGVVPAAAAVAFVTLWQRLHGA